MTRIVQWNCKGLRVRHVEAKFLMNRSQPFCICLQELMLEKVKYNLEGEYKFYVIIPLIQRSKGGTAIAIKKEIEYQKLKYKNGHSGGGSESLHDRKRKRTIYLP